MEILNIITGEKRIAVSVDGVNHKEIVFNPNDVRFVEHLHRFYAEAMAKAREWQERQADIEKRIAEAPTDDNGMPLNVGPIVEPLHEIDDFMRGQIDTIFGAGTAAEIFGDAVYRNPAVYVQLIEGIRKYIEPTRAAKVEKYVRRKPGPKAKAKRKRTK